MQSRDFSQQGFDQPTVEGELQMNRGSNKTRYRFEGLDYNLNKIRDIRGISGGSFANERDARIPRTSKMSIREIPSGLADYRSLVLADKPVGYWPLGTTDSLFLSFAMITAGDAFFYRDMTSVADYTIQTGDTLEYDIFLGASGNLIGFDYICSDATTLRGAGATDQNGLNASPLTDVSAYANGMWYHRRIPLPSGHVGKLIQKYDLACENNVTGTYTGQIRNIQITDGAGKQRFNIYTGGQAVPTLATDRDSGGGQSLTVTQRAIDLTGNGLDGSYINSGTGDAPGLLPGVVDTALKCTNSAAGNVSVPDAAALKPTAAIAWEAWIYPTDISTTVYIVASKRITGSHVIQLAVNGGGIAGNLRWSISRATVITSVDSGAGVLAANQPYYIVGTYDGARQNLYINSLFIASTAVTGAIDTSTDAFVMGGSADASAGFAGNIDEVAFYNYALSPTQIRLHYDAGQGNQNEINYESDRIKAYAGLWMPFQRYRKDVGEFNQAANFEGWAATNITSPAISGPFNVAGNLNGTWTGTSNTTAPSIAKTGLSYPVSPFSSVEVRMRISASGSPADNVILQWQNTGDTTFSGGKQISLAITDDGGFRTLVFAGITGDKVIGLQLLLGTKNSATIEIDYIRPTEPFVAGGGTWIEWPLGVFLPSTSARDADASGITRVVDGFDLTQILVDDKVTAPYVVASGANYITAVTTLLTNAAPGVSIAYNAVADARTLPGEKDWPTGTEKLDIINQLLAAINYKPLWIDENGVAQIQPFVQPVNRAAEYTFDASKSGVSLIEANLTENIELFSVPNFALVSRQSAKGGTAILQAQAQNLSILSPTSFYRRGNRNVVQVASQDAADGTSLTTFAANLLNKSSNLQVSAVFSSPFFPDSHDDVFNVIHPPLGINSKMNESKWVLDFTAEGGPMIHTVTQAVS